MTEYRAPKGTSDMLPAVASSWEWMLGAARDLFGRYGYEPIYTPTFEHTEVFARGIGEATDIVGKEMYTFLDKGDPPRSLTLRPEGTASVVRAALEHGLTANGQGAKLYYAGPMFRYERPQKGRMRQFWQIGLEALGLPEPSADAEVIALLVRYFEALGLPAASMRLLVNSMGDQECRPAYREKVAEHIRASAAGMCQECAKRAGTNPLRAFDCKAQGCVQAMSSAPLLRDFLCESCRDHHEAVQALLGDLGIAYEEAPRLVRGLDYYTRTVFEIQVDAGLGSQNAIGGGGRYDRLMETYGGPPTPGLGWALGFERTLLALTAAGVGPERACPTDVFVVAVEPGARHEVFRLVSEGRDAGLAVDMDHQGRSLKSQMKQADRSGARLVVIAGPDELAAGEVTVRDMRDGAQSRVARSGLPASLRALLGGS